jgi:hypothetical protein
VHGAKTRKFFAKLVRLHYASMYDCRHNRARIYHVNQRALYAAIGEADSKLRRPLTLNHAIQRLMVLDAIVEDPEMIWLGTTEDKTNHLTALTSITPEDLPHVSIRNGERRSARSFPDRLPVGIQLSGRGVLVYVALDPTLTDFRLFLERHSAVLRALPAWTVRVVVPPQFSDLAQRVKQAFFTQLAMPALSPEDIAAVRQRFESVRTQHYPFDFGPRTTTSKTATYSPHRSTTCCSSSGRRRATRRSPAWRQAPFRMPCRPGPGRSKRLNSATGTVISLPWRPSPRILQAQEAQRLASTAP